MGKVLPDGDESSLHKTMKAPYDVSLRKVQVVTAVCLIYLCIWLGIKPERKGASLSRDLNEPLPAIKFGGYR